MDNNLSDSIRKCNFCGEDIRAGARRCPYCGSVLDQNSTNTGLNNPGNQNTMNAGFGNPDNRKPVNPGFANPANPRPINPGFDIPNDQNQINTGFGNPNNQDSINTEFGNPSSQDIINRGFNESNNKDSMSTGFGNPNNKNPISTVLDNPNGQNPVDSGLNLFGRIPEQPQNYDRNYINTLDADNRSQDVERTNEGESFNPFEGSMNQARQENRPEGRQNSFASTEQSYLRPSQAYEKKPLGNGMKVFLTAVSATVPGIGQLIGIIIAIIFMNSDDDADRKSFGLALLVASLAFFVISSCVSCAFWMVASNYTGL